MNTPVLYSFRRCPYAMRARLALAAAGVAHQTIEVSLRDKPAELLAISPKGTVPVLVLTDGTVIDQSASIMRWALAQNDPLGWLQASSSQQIEGWLQHCDATFKPLLDRYKYWNRYPECSQEAHRERALVSFLRPMNDQLGMNLNQDGYALCGRTSLADAAIFPFVRQFAAVDNPWFDAEPLPALQAWLGSWLNSELFLLIMKKQ